MFLQADLSEVVKFINQCNRDYYLGWKFCGESEGRAAWYLDPEVIKAKEVPLADGVVSIEYDILPSGESKAFKALESYLLKRFKIPTDPTTYKSALQPERMRLLRAATDWQANEFLRTGNLPDLNSKDTQERFKAEREKAMIGTAEKRARAFLEESLQKRSETPNENSTLNISQKAGDYANQINARDVTINQNFYSQSTSPGKTILTNAEERRLEPAEPSQSETGYEKAVFVSYAWGGESESTVDELERAFAQNGINIVRDKKHLDYKGSIEAFEQRIGKGQCVVLVVSDKYLRSEHCMYELAKVAENQNLRERVFPIVLADAHIWKAIERLGYIQDWDGKIEELNQAIKQTKEMTGLAGFIADLEKFKRIRDSFDHLTDLLRDMNALTPEIHKSSGFSTLIQAVKQILAGK
ncbi:MAG: toll/interleukin-1 receptor domain-containing protein [Chloroflexota bacterium]